MPRTSLRFIFFRFGLSASAALRFQARSLEVLPIEVRKNELLEGVDLFVNPAKAVSLDPQVLSLAGVYTSHRLRTLPNPRKEHVMSEWGFRRSRALIPKESRTAFRDEPEHHRSVATLASRLCKKCSASSRKTIRSAAEEGCR